jgi:hypothetical protein
MNLLHEREKEDSKIFDPLVLELKKYFKELSKERFLIINRCC